MNRVSPAELRKTLQLVDRMVEHGIGFIPVPYKSEQDMMWLVELVSKRLDEMEKGLDDG